MKTPKTIVLRDCPVSPPEDSSRETIEEKTRELVQQIQDLQTLLYAESKRRVLIILQGMDTAGKNGTVKKVLAETDPNGVRVVGFKKPTENETARDYLWRVHHQVPQTGELVVFNRSHYEDVIVPQVRELLPQSTIERRFEHIKAFEQMLQDEGTTVLKFFLHIDSNEQARRLQKRIENPKKHWKLAASDFEDRKLWDKFQTTYETTLNATHTSRAPWHVVPSNAKWYRNFIVAQVLTEKLASLGMRYPEPSIDVANTKL